MPDRGLRAFPRCKPSPSYVYSDSGDPKSESDHNTDIVGGKYVSWTSSPLGQALALRSASVGKNRFNGAKVSPSDEATLKKLKRIKNVIVIREHKDASDDHVSADMFVVAGDPAKIVCAFGFDGGDPSYGSVGQVTGKEVRSSDSRTAPYLERFLAARAHRRAA